MVAENKEIEISNSFILKSPYIASIKSKVGDNEVSLNLVDLVIILVGAEDNPAEVGDFRFARSCDLLRDVR